VVESTLSDEQYVELAKVWNAGPICQYFGFDVSFVKGEKVVVDLRDIHAGKRGGKGVSAVNGAVLSAMFDFAIGCTPLIAAPDRISATVQLSIQFMRGTLGNVARCESRVDRLTSTMVFANAVVFDENGVPCARCTGISALGKPRSFEEPKGALMSKK